METVPTAPSGQQKMRLNSYYITIFKFHVCFEFDFHLTSAITGRRRLIVHCKSADFAAQVHGIVNN